jgi:hypothetical protein
MNTESDPMSDNVDTSLLDRRRDNDAYSRFIDVQAALRMWRRTLIAEMASAPSIPDDENTEIILDLLHGEIAECGLLMNATTEAAERMLQRRISKGHGQTILMHDPEKEKSQ